MLPCLQQIEAAVAAGHYAAGFVAYEAAAAFDASFVTHQASGLPLVWFGIYPHYTSMAALAYSTEDYTLGQWRAAVKAEQYRQTVSRIKQHLSAGDSYQVNYTFPFSAAFRGDAMRFFIDLQNAQHANYSAYLDIGRFRICSVSPELFFFAQCRSNNN